MSEPQRVSYGTGPRPEDDVPSENMLEMVRHGAHITPREAMVPPPDAVDRVKIAVVDGDDPTVASYVFELGGAGDPVMKEVVDRYATAATGPRSQQDRIAEAAAVYMEVCAAKRATGQEVFPVSRTAGSVASTAPRTREESAPQRTAPAKPPSVQLTFDLGPAGRMIGRYRSASIQETLLVLVADEDAVESGLYLPPNTGASPDGAISVIIPGLPKPVRVFSMDMTFRYEGSVFCILLIDRSDE